MSRCLAFSVTEWLLASENKLLCIECNLCCGLLLNAQCIRIVGFISSSLVSFSYDVLFVPVVKFG